MNVGEKKRRGNFRLAVDQQERALLDVGAGARRVSLSRDDEDRHPQHDADESARCDAFQQQSAEVEPFGTDAHANVVDSLPAAHCRHPRSVRDFRRKDPIQAGGFVLRGAAAAGDASLRLA